MHEPREVWPKFGRVNRRCEESISKSSILEELALTQPRTCRHVLKGEDRNVASTGAMTKSQTPMLGSIAKPGDDGTVDSRRW